MLKRPEVVPKRLAQSLEVEHIWLVITKYITNEEGQPLLVETKLQRPVLCKT